MEVVIGLEVHVELGTKTKIFCGCKKSFGLSPNSCVCPVCLGLPGSIPVLNKRAVDLAITAGFCFNSEIAEDITFDRKNYFYPDLPKGYQITQRRNPLCKGGFVKLSDGKKIELDEVHLEEDAGKLVHGEDGLTLIDYNRAGIPLIEIVTKPVLSSGSEVVEFLQLVREKLIFAEVSECKMEQGQMRVDVNISVKFDGVQSSRVEIKNMNSLKAIEKAIDFEKERHLKMIENCEEVASETSGWNEETGETFSMRVKQNAFDYRYFPEPDITPIEIDSKTILRLQKKFPEAIETIRRTYAKLGVSENDIKVITSSKDILDYFEECLDITNLPKETANWIVTDVLKFQNVFPQLALSEIVNPKDLGELIVMVSEEKLSRTTAKLILEELVSKGKKLANIIKEFDLKEDVLVDEIIELVGEIIGELPNIKDDYLSDTEKIENFVIGRVMKITRGMAKIDDIKIVLRKMIDINS